MMVGWMIDICSGISINEDELMFETIQSGGPGGQNVNGVCRKSLTSLQATQLLYQTRLLRE